jgi:hypothetical protein
MSGPEPAVGDAVLVDIGDGERIKGTIRERTKTHATVDCERQFDVDRNLEGMPPADESVVVTLDQVLKRFDE